MAASKAALTEIMTPDVYDHLNGIHKILSEGCTAAIEKHRLPAYARRSAEEIDAAIAEERMSWD
jgi:glutamate-1-semialdehyde aminotransferase